MDKVTFFVFEYSKEFHRFLEGTASNAEVEIRCELDEIKRSIVAWANEKPYLHGGGPFYYASADKKMVGKVVLREVLRYELFNE